MIIAFRYIQLEYVFTPPISELGSLRKLERAKKTNQGRSKKILSFGPAWNWHPHTYPKNKAY
jgi:hypothetical protein